MRRKKSVDEILTSSQDEKLILSSYIFLFVMDTETQILNYIWLQ